MRTMPYRLNGATSDITKQSDGDFDRNLALCPAGPPNWRREVQSLQSVMPEVVNSGQPANPPRGPLSSGEPVTVLIVSLYLDTMHRV